MGRDRQCRSKQNGRSICHLRRKTVERPSLLRSPTSDKWTKIDNIDRSQLKSVRMVLPSCSETRPTIIVPARFHPTPPSEGKIDQLSSINCRSIFWKSSNNHHFYSESQLKELTPEKNRQHRSVLLGRSIIVKMFDNCSSDMICSFVLFSRQTGHFSFQIGHSPKYILCF